MEINKMRISMEFARRDDCLDNMVPSDLRLLVGERDKLKAQLAAHREFVKAFDAFRVESFDDIDVDSYFEGWIDMGNIAKARQALEEK